MSLEVPALRATPGPPGVDIRTTARAVVLDRGRVLLMRDDLGRQVLPGGGQEHGEPLEATVRREALEEAALRVRVERLLWIREYVKGDPPEHSVEVAFLCAAEDDPSAARLGGGAGRFHRGVSWLPLAQARTANLRPADLGVLLADLANGEPPPAAYLGLTR